VVYHGESGKIHKNTSYPGCKAALNPLACRTKAALKPLIGFSAYIFLTIMTEFSGPDIIYVTNCRTTEN
jgi:hypothetical protein